MIGEKQAVPYHANLENVARDRNLSSWKNGSHRWMVATTAIGAGVHVLGVYSVFIYLGAYTLYDLVQQIGRADTDGTANVAVYTSSQATARRNMSRTSNQQVWRWLDSSDCRFHPLSLFMDGNPGPRCYETHRPLCDNCEKDYRGWTCVLVVSSSYSYNSPSHV